MTDESSPLLPDDERARDGLRAALAVACALAVVLAGAVVPAVPGAGLGGTPLGSLVPTPNTDPYGPAGGGESGRGLASGSLGALNPGDSTGVGGSLAENASAFRSQNAETHFTVRSTVPSYWRTGAYDTYTGSGWERSRDRQRYTGPVGNDGISDREVRYRVTLQRSATALPSVWRPNSLSGTGTDALYLTDRRAFVTDSPVRAGTTYEGVSHTPPRDPTVLRTAGREYPADVERRYTALPADTDRLAAFTDELTSDADSPYGTARRIESWLEANKNYSLNASEVGDGVASRFVFEMERGYCEYFATAMTVMLRSQGVPARYAVGYSTGQSVGANTYRVRALNAHAWVEAYFPDVGWVRFDPTPGRARLQSEQQALQNRTSADPSAYDHTESGSPGESFSPNESATATTAGSPPGGTAAPGGANATPGADSPPSGSDRPTATTAGTGESAPGESGPSGESGTASGTGESAPGADGTSGTGERDGTGDSDETGEGSDSGERSESGETTSGSDDGRSPAESAYRVELNRTPVPGATVEVAVTDDGDAAFGVPVFFNGERVGVTDTEGTVTAQVPYAEDLTITLGRERPEAVAAPPGFGPPPDSDSPTALAQTAGPPGALRAGFASASDLPDSPDSLALSGPPRAQSAGNGTGNATDGRAGTDRRTGTEYSLATDAALAVSGDPQAGETVVVTATVRGVPVRNAPVGLDGQRVGTTDDSGRAEVRLPDAPGNVTLSVTRGSVSGETTVTVPELAVAVDPRLPLALPGLPVEVRATYGGDPLADAGVRVGDANRTTDINGTASAPLPFRSSAAVVVSASGQTRRTTVSGLFVNLAGLLGGAALVVSGLALAARRRGFGPGGLLAGVLAGLRAVPNLAVAALFGAADRLAWAVETVLDALRKLRAGETTVRRLLARLRGWLRGRALAVYERVLAARRNASATLGGSGAASAGDSANGTPDDPPDDSYRTLREAWDTFLGAVSVRRPSALTPGELADHAVREDDLPPGAVVTLRDAFRDVEYGARSPDDRLPQVETAVAAIERATREADAEGDGIPPADAGGDD